LANVKPLRRYALNGKVGSGVSQRFRDATKNSILRLNEVVFVVIGSGGQIWEIRAVAKPPISLSFRGELAGVYLLTTPTIRNAKAIVRSATRQR
jgi:hypothetical protein